ncbi:hypothetical protein [Dactylosporangium sp. NPDC049140]|uniref:hypothetical protein n=1 Tax=Dactylosporangium sp. NPDC049140 TaxID=3155647 RepID=UPI0033CA9F30
MSSSGSVTGSAPAPSAAFSLASGYRLRSDDAAALTPGATVQVWVLPGDLSEVRVARPGDVDRILPFQAAPEVSGEYPDGGIDGLGDPPDRLR